MCDTDTGQIVGSDGASRTGQRDGPRDFSVGPALYTGRDNGTDRGIFRCVTHGTGFFNPP